MLKNILSKIVPKLLSLGPEKHEKSLDFIFNIIILVIIVVLVVPHYRTIGIGNMISTVTAQFVYEKQDTCVP